MPIREQRECTSTSSPKRNLGAEVDLDAGEDDRPELAERVEARLLEVRGVDGVVHVAERVDVAETHVFANHEREAAHCPML